MCLSQKGNGHIVRTKDIFPPENKFLFQKISLLSHWVRGTSLERDTREGSSYHGRNSRDTTSPGLGTTPGPRVSVHHPTVRTDKPISTRAAQALGPTIWAGIQFVREFPIDTRHSFVARLTAHGRDIDTSADMSWI